MAIKSVMSLLVPLVLLAGATGCAGTPRTSDEGYVDVIGGRVWYRVVGSGPGTPLLVIHGGPGLPHQYLQSLSELANDRPVIFYDQLGCGKSDAGDGVARWIPRRFAREIEAIRRELGLQEVYLYADSWGAVFATEYMLTLPKGVRGVILSSPILSGPRYVADAQHLLDQMPPDVRQTIRNQEGMHATGSPQYKDAYQRYYRQHVLRANTEPSELQDARAHLGQDVYRAMHGANQIQIDGSLANYDRTGELWQLNAPTLLLCGRYDEVSPETVAYYQSRMNRARMQVFRKSSHMPIFEEHDAYIATIRRFLRNFDR